MMLSIDVIDPGQIFVTRTVCSKLGISRCKGKSQRRQRLSLFCTNISSAIQTHKLNTGYL